MDQVSKFRYIPPAEGRPWDPRRFGGLPDVSTPTTEDIESTPTGINDGEHHVGSNGEKYLRGHPNGKLQQLKLANARLET